MSEQTCEIVNLYSSDEARPHCPNCGVRVEQPEDVDPVQPWRAVCSYGHAGVYQLEVEAPGCDELAVDLALNAAQAAALAQFIKRVGWSEMRGCAVDDNEAYLIRAALDVVRKGLAEIGFNPR